MTEMFQQQNGRNVSAKENSFKINETSNS